MPNGLRPDYVLFQLDAVGGEFKSPGIEQRQRETDDQQKQNRLEDPVRRGKTFESKFCDLRDQPGHNHIGDADPEDIPALEFVDKGHNGLFVTVGEVYSARGLKHGPISVIFLVFARIFDRQSCVDTNEQQGAVHVCFWLRSQPVNATQALNLSAGVSNSNV